MTVKTVGLVSEVRGPLLLDAIRFQATLLPPSRGAARLRGLPAVRLGGRPFEPDPARTGEGSWNSLPGVLSALLLPAGLLFL